MLLLSVAAQLFTTNTVQAASLANESFTGVSTSANAWISGGSGGSVACLTAATSSTLNSIPACAGGPFDSSGSGVLRLTPTGNHQSGFAIYNTPISSNDGLNIEFDMYQYGGTGADGISFFLIDGSQSPSQPGAAGGSLGYSGNTTGSLGIVGGYVGVGFDRFGNFSSLGSGPGGPGPQSNTIAVRGSEASNYQFVANTPADGSLSGTTRANSGRNVRVTISTNNIMSVAVNYGSGFVTELSNIDLEAINGAGSLPANFKFGFAAATGGATNTHEIRGLAVNTNLPNVGIDVSHSGSFVQGSIGQFAIAVNNGTSAEATTGNITVTDTLPAGLTPTSASGTGWSCNISGQTVTCIRSAVLAPGASAPNITLNVDVANNAAASLGHTASLATADNANLTPSDTDIVTILAGSYQDNDGIFNSVEHASPNGGDANNDSTPDSQQSSVTSLVDPVTSSYAVLETSGCSGSNANVSVTPESANTIADGSYAYPVGLMDFTINCINPGDTATVVQYYFGSHDVSKMVVRKYNSVTNTYQTVPGATITNVTIGGAPAIKIVYQITDGSSLDEDGVANGTIVDPTGPAVLGDSVISTLGAPNTGFQQQSPWIQVIPLLLGIGLLGHEYNRIRVTRRTKGN